MPIITFECSGCDLRGANSASWGIYRYLDETGEVPLTRALGICEDCNGFQAIESFDDIDEVRTKIAQFRNPFRRTGHWILRTLARFETFKDDMPSKDIREEYASLYRRFDLIHKRRGDERCLVCGGRNVIPFTGKYKYSIQGCDHESKTGFLHPRCGGEILYKSTGLRISYAFEVQTYSLDGEKLDA